MTQNYLQQQKQRPNIASLLRCATDYNATLQLVCFILLLLLANSFL